MARTVIELGADCNEPDEMMGLLALAVHAGDHKMTHLLLDCAADAKGPPGTKMPPLMLAVMGDDAAMAGLLLDGGADPTVDHTLSIARIRNNSEVLAVIRPHLGTHSFDRPL